MDRGGDELIGWSIDGVAAGLLGAALGACLLLLGMAMPAVMAAAPKAPAPAADLRLHWPSHCVANHSIGLPAW